MKKRITGITSGAMAALTAYDYPGNVRELRNVVERAIILAAGPEIGEREVILPVRREARADPSVLFEVKLGPDGAPPTMEALERSYVAHLMQHCGGKRGLAAQAAGISYPTFLKKLRELGITDDDEPRRGA